MVSQSLPTLFGYIVFDIIIDPSRLLIFYRSKITQPLTPKCDIKRSLGVITVKDL